MPMLVTLLPLALTAYWRWLAGQAAAHQPIRLIQYNFRRWFTWTVWFGWTCAALVWRFDLASLATAAGIQLLCYAVAWPVFRRGLTAPPELLPMASDVDAVCLASPVMLPWPSCPAWL
jgi:hypothetical protein